jgi:GNAT superfamily N-acetyltransferase
MQISEVRDKKGQQDFLNAAREVYKNDPVWVCPLDNDVEAVFDPRKNNFHQFGECTRWVLHDHNGKLIGRIAAFINKKKAYNYEQPTGGCGFFECVDDHNAADLLFDTAKDWLSQRGMQAMDGPINFGENDMWWGLLVEGFSKPYYGMNYNPPYYKRLFEQYGFRPLYEQISNKLSKNNPFPERFTKIANWVASKPGIEIRHLEIRHLKKYAHDFLEVYNDAWRDFENFTPITEATIMESFEKMKPIVNEKLIWFAYVDGKPASFVLILPDTNELIRGLNGKLDLWGKIRFLWNKHVVGNQRMRAVIMGTAKSYQRLGLESALFIKIKDYARSTPYYTELELSWVGDFNKAMLSIHQATGAVFAKKHITYRYHFQ